MNNIYLEPEETMIPYMSEYAVENLYYLLYYNYVDASNGHFINRIDPWIQNQSHEDMIEECIALAQSISETPEKCTLEEFLNNIVVPEDVQPAIAELKAHIKNNISLKIYLKILKAILLLRNFNRYNPKEVQINEQINNYLKGYLTEDELDEWIIWLKEELAKTPEEKEKESQEYLDWLMKQELKNIDQDEYCPSAAHGDYSPSCPWNAPGMSVSDFI